MNRAKLPPGEEVVIILRESNGNLVFGVDAKVLYKRTPDPAIWGIMIADLVQHVTNSLEGKLGTPEGPMPREKIFERITETLSKELQTNQKHARRVTPKGLDS